MQSIKHRYLRIVDRINSLASVLMAILLIVMVIIIFSQVFYRFVLGDTIVWSEELARYIMVWGVFLGVSYATRKNMLIAVMILPESLPEKYQRWLQNLVQYIIIFFSLLLIYYGGSMIQFF